MIKIYEEQTDSIFKIQKDLNLDKMRLYRYANGKCSVENMPPKLLNDLAIYFNIEPFVLLEKMKEYSEKIVRKGNKNE